MAESLYMQNGSYRDGSLGGCNCVSGLGEMNIAQKAVLGVVGVGWLCILGVIGYAVLHAVKEEKRYKAGGRK